MFKIVATPRAWWPVIWPGVSEDGEIIENQIEFQFQILAVDDAIVVMRKGVEVQAEMDALSEDKPMSVSLAEIVAMLALNWRGVLAENGEPLPFTPDNLAKLMNVPGLYEHVMEAYRGLMSAKKAVREGN